MAYQTNLNTIIELDNQMTNCYGAVFTRILEKGRSTLHRDLYINSGTLNRVLRNHPDQTRFSNVNNVYIMDMLAQRGTLVKHTFQNPTTNRKHHYYSLPGVGRPEEPPIRGKNMI